MSSLFALAAAISIASGLFLTKSVTQRLPGYHSVGVLFFFNAVVAAPFLLLDPQWVQLSAIAWLRIATGGSLTALGAGLIFLVVTRSSASASAVGQSLSPAVVLVIAPLILGTTVSFAQIVVVLILVTAVLLPLRNSLAGVSTLSTFVLIGSIALTTGAVTTLIALQIHAGMALVQVVFIQQLIAAGLFLILFFPKHFTAKNYLSLFPRSIFMGAGWVLTSYAISHGSPVVVQSIISTVPLWILLFETVAYKKSPSKSVIVSSCLACAGICALAFLF